MSSKYIAPQGQDAPPPPPQAAPIADAAIPPPPTTIDVPLPGGQVGAVPVDEIGTRLARGAELESQASQLAFLQERANRAQTDPAYAAALNQIDLRVAQGLPPMPTAQTADDILSGGTDLPPVPTADTIKLQTIEAELQDLRRSRDAERLRAEIESAVAVHPTLTGNETAMKVAATNAAASLAAVPGMTAANAVAAAAKQVDALIGGQRELDARKQDLREAPGAPTASASLTPNLTSDDDLPPPELMGVNARKSLHDGSFRDAMLAFADRKSQELAKGRTPSQ